MKLHSTGADSVGASSDEGLPILRNLYIPSSCGIAAFSQLLKIPLPGLVLVVVGGLLYTLGAVVYAFRRPDPIPHVFGYHELFHVLTLGAVGCQYAAIAFFVLPDA